MNMTIKNLIPLLSVLIFCCSDETKHKNEINIELTQTITNDIAFNELYNTFPFASLKNSFPAYYKEQLNSFGLTENDSVIIATLNMDYRRFKFELFQAGYVNKAAYDDLRIDSLLEREKPNQKQLVAGISFKNGKQIVSIDANNNNDFSDDEAVVFDEDFRFHASDSNIINKLPIINFNYWSKTKNITYFNRKIIVYPHSNYPGFGYSADEFENKSRLIAKFKDAWQGNFNYNAKEYDVAVQGGNSVYSTILIKPKHLNFSNSSAAYNYNFTYQLKDTIQVANALFVLDSLNDDVTQLNLKRIELHPDNFFSDKVGYKLFDFELVDINQQTAKLSEITKNRKRYTLLDFWGTWCKPCLELTPKLKQLNKDYSNDIQIISVALDNDIAAVKSYTKEHHMDWFQGFVSRQNRQGSIISELSIKDYPTFVLLDENMKIVYRNAGIETFNEIEKIIKSE
jgi:thiol-disulfide isomerase/thioredoxin